RLVSSTVFMSTSPLTNDRPSAYETANHCSVWGQRLQAPAAPLCSFSQPRLRAQATCRVRELVVREPREVSRPATDPWLRRLSVRRMQTSAQRSRSPHLASAIRRRRRNRKATPGCRCALTSLPALRRGNSRSRAPAAQTPKPLGVGQRTARRRTPVGQGQRRNLKIAERSLSSALGTG